jgi:HPt (histidine-containing phosphotransfer) domain-containing protein
LTANALKHDQKNYQEIGCAGFIAKPINREQFETVLSQYLHREQMSVANPAFKIRRRNNLPEDDVPSQVSVIGQFPEQTQLVARKPESQQQPVLAAPNVTQGENFNNALQDLARVLERPLVKEFMQTVLQRERVEVTSVDAEPEQQPIYSTIIQDDPDMIDVVRQYVASLEKLKLDLNEAIARKDWQQVSKMVHDIKGSGGAFGYPQLSDLAKELDQLIKLKKFNETHALIDDLNTTYNRILAARF